MVIRTGAASVALAVMMTIASASFDPAQAQAPIRFDIPAQDLATSLGMVASISGRQVIIATGAVRGKTAHPLHGDFSADEAIAKLLYGSGVTAQYTEDAVLVGTPSTAGVSDTTAVSGNPIIVTGSRIRGAPPVAPIISAKPGDILDAGQTDLGEYVRSLPESFSGGQNPGVGTAAAGAQNENLNSASSINLRGLGPDATLTLLNGHRMAYNGAEQAIDISAIPLAALDRIEIIADGASALYGSDAVGGVANIILRRDFDGLEALGRLGTSTSGGDFERQASLTGGSRWQTGGFMVSYNFERDSAILAGDRSITNDLNQAQTLVRPELHNSVVLAAHQNLDTAVDFSIDGMFDDRETSNVLPFGPFASYRESGRTGEARTKAYSIAPAIRVTLPAGWEASAQGSYGASRAFYGNDIYAGGADLVHQRGCYCNKEASLEAGAEGSLFQLPAGPIRLAAGGGYRWNELHAFRTSGSPQDIKKGQSVYFAYGETSLPLASPDQGLTFIHRALVSGALRYENYPGIGHLFTPRLGAIFSPTSGFDLKGSWGKSFKAPTLYQQYSPQYATYDYASYYSSAEVPSTSTIIELTGGNLKLKPERATTWSVTLDVHPDLLGGLDISTTYFKINYRDRIVQPIVYDSVALSDPIYRDLVNLAPSGNDKAAAISSAALFNYTDGDYDPSSVIAIIDNLYLNVARQTIHGVDVHAKYDVPLGSRGKLTATGNISYLRSTERMSAEQPLTKLAGSLFNPPHWHAREGLTWSDPDTAVTAYLSYIGGVSDKRTSPTEHVPSVTTLDLSARKAFRTDRIGQFELLLAVSNVLNDLPSRIATDDPDAEPYDSTNYSVIGRTISITASIKW